MTQRIAENQIHVITLTLPFDLSGRTLQAHYVSRSGTVTDGGTATGDVEGAEVTITTDLAAQAIMPGSYRLEVTYDDSGTQRELALQGTTRIRVHDAHAIP
jgi:hypothetical protein